MKSEEKFALVRIAFGLIWAIDAAFKWMPGVRDHITDTIAQAQSGQPAWEQAWIGLWVHMASLNPELFGILIASIETALALSLISGVCSKWSMYLGIPFVLMIWSVPQGFGGPYASGATDIDSGLIYALVFVTLILGHAWERYNAFSLLRNS